MRFPLITVMALLASAAGAQPAAVRPEPAPAGQFNSIELPDLRVDVHRLWPGRAPGAKTDRADDVPTLTVLRPQGGRANGSAVIIAPGGAYIGLAAMLEGVEPAGWFTARGVTVFILQYRTGPAARLPLPLLDGARAVRFVRANAKTFAIDPGRIGMMGFSAGGHLAATTAVDASPGDAKAGDPVERVSDRPDFLILAYPWLEGMQLRPDGGSQYCDFARMRGGPACQPGDYVRHLPVAHVKPATPPTFLYHTTNDELVPVAGTVRFYQALIAQGVPAELHAFEAGAHGSGLGGSSAALSNWPLLLDQWLRSRGLLTPPGDKPRP